MLLCFSHKQKHTHFFIYLLIGQPPDLLAFFLTIIMGSILIAGVKKSILFNNILNGINFVVWIFIMAVGMYYSDSKNWSENGGFMPYGWSGVSVVIIY